MQQFFKKNLSLVLAFLLPLLLIFIVALNAYVPTNLFKTAYNFVYAACDGADYDYASGCDRYLKTLYTVKEGRIIVNDIDPAQDSDWDKTTDREEKYTVRIFLHNTTENVSREISIEEAQNLRYSSLLTSPDDVTISSGYDTSPGFLFFDGGSSYGQYLTKGKLRNKLKLIHNDRYYAPENFYFIGWILH